MYTHTHIHTYITAPRAGRTTFTMTPASCACRAALSNSSPRGNKQQ